MMARRWGWEEGGGSRLRLVFFNRDDEDMSLSGRSTRNGKQLYSEERAMKSTTVKCNVAYCFGLTYCHDIQLL